MKPEKQTVPGNGDRRYNPIRSMRTLADVGMDQKVAEVLAIEISGALEKQGREFHCALEKQGQEFHCALEKQGQEFRDALNQTRHEFHDALEKQGQELSRRMDGLEYRMDKLEHRMARLEEQMSGMIWKVMASQVGFIGVFIGALSLFFRFFPGA